ncbi:olfactory receptor 52K1-like [Protopterus annectens]|uniref:olfactory receptor 52K1-like n=1 Tax=Protopterus annectens TaxID=7888 RepID=UPI001CFB9ABC|nr:olfactory receptor 52K1-like [Protopterus annectens]
MTTSNWSVDQELHFILTGFPGLHSIHSWISIPFLFIFLVMLFGNLTVLLVIATEQSLHEPMYYLISFLSVVDLLIGVTLLPQLLIILWLGSQTIRFDSCILQMFFLSFVVSMESSVLVLMAYDRFVAVCKPLRYSAVITNKFILKGGFAISVRSLCIVLPLPVLATALKYNSKSIIDNVYCEYFAVVSAAQIHSALNDIYLYLICFLVILPDTVMIGLSYYMIVRAALKLRSKEAQLKLFSTCSSHVLGILSFYISGAVSLLVFLVENEVPIFMHSLFSVLYISVPPTVNPLIYGIKTKAILTVILKHAQNIKNMF